MPSRSIAFVLSLLAFGVLSCGKDPEVAKREFLKSGDAYVAQGKLGEAAIEYRNAIQQDARYGEARFKLAETLLKTGNAVGAYQQFVRAADLMPGNAEAQIKAGTMNLLAAQYQDAKARADKVLAADPKNVEAQVLLGTALAGLRKTDAAIATIEAAIKADPSRSRSYASLGDVQLATGKVDAAETSYTRAVEADPKSIPARMSLATFQWRAGRREKAEAELKETLALDASNVEVNRMLASLYLATNRVPLAEAPLKTIAEVTKDVPSRMLLADYYRVSKRLPDAEKVLDTLEKDPKGFVPAKTRKAVIRYGQGLKKEGYAEIDAAIAKDAKSVEAILIKSDFLASDRRLEDALKTAETAVASDNSVAAAHFAVGRLRRALGKTEGAIAAFNEVLRLNPRATAAQLELSRAYLAAGRPKDTLQFAQDVLAVQPRNPDALLLQARGLMGVGDLRGAETATATLVRGYSTTPIVHIQLGDLQLRKGDVGAARAAYQRALAIDPQSIDAVTGLAAVDLRTGKGPDARARVDAALAKRPDSVALLLLAGRVAAQMKDYAASEQAFRRVLELDSSNVDVYGLLGNLYQAQGRTDQAITEFERLAAKTEKPAGVHTLIGTLLESQDKVEEAKKRYEQALGFEHDAPVAANNLAWLIAEHGGNLDVALQLAQTAKSKLPESPAVGDTLGWVYYKKGLFTQAVAALKDSVARQPDTALFQYHLGLSSAKSGDTALARTSLEKALKLDPRARDAEQARTELARLGAAKS